MNVWLMIIFGWIAVALLMAVLWLVQRQTSNAGIVDVAWSTSVGVLACFFCWSQTDGLATRRWLVSLLALTWALRLSWHVWRRVSTESEDGRYVELKRTWGDDAPWKMFRFYQLQAIGALLFALPMLLAASNRQPLEWLDVMGVAIWILAIVGEAVADHQLATFKLDPENKGKVCQTGLWRYSRHPNYFFEWLHWWSYVCFAVAAPFGWLTIIGPLAMLHFICNVTGIPPTEKQALKSRGDEYRRYQQTTSPFFPWFRQGGRSYEKDLGL